VLKGIAAQNTYDYSINAESVNLYLGNSHYLSGNIDEAKKVYENALKANPNSSKIIHNLGIIEFQLSNHIRSVELFSKAISIAPELIVAHRNKGYALIQNGEYEKALDDLIKYVSKKPFDADTLRLIGLCYSNLDIPKNAIKYYKAYYKLSKDKDIIFDIANEYFSEQKYWLCFFTLLANFVRPKQYSRSFGTIADYLGKINYISFAEFVYSIAIFLDKSNPYLYFSRAHTRTLDNRKKEAVDDFLKAINIESKLADAYYNLGNLYMSDKNYESAVEKYSVFLKLMPDSLDGLFNRAQGYYFLEQYDLSINDAQNYIALSDDPDGKGHTIVGHNYLKKGMLNEGINFLIEAYNKQPSEQLQNTIEQLKRI
jgi:superkiller protein 3